MVNLFFIFFLCSLTFQTILDTTHKINNTGRQLAADFLTIEKKVKEEAGTDLFGCTQGKFILESISNTSRFDCNGDGDTLFYLSASKDKNGNTIMQIRSPDNAKDMVQFLDIKVAVPPNDKDGDITAKVILSYLQGETELTTQIAQRKDTNFFGKVANFFFPEIPTLPFRQKGKVSYKIIKDKQAIGWVKDGCKFLIAIEDDEVESDFGYNVFVHIVCGRDRLEVYVPFSNTAMAEFNNALGEYKGHITSFINKNSLNSPARKNTDIASMVQVIDGLIKNECKQTYFSNSGTSQSNKKSQASNVKSGSQKATKQKSKKGSKPINIRLLSQSRPERALQIINQKLYNFYKITVEAPNCFLHGTEISLTYFTGFGMNTIHYVLNNDYVRSEQSITVDEDFTRDVVSKLEEPFVTLRKFQVNKTETEKANNINLSDHDVVILLNTIINEIDSAKKFHKGDLTPPCNPCEVKDQDGKKTIVVLEKVESLEEVPYWKIIMNNPTPKNIISAKHREISFYPYGAVHPKEYIEYEMSKFFTGLGEKGQ